MFSKSFFSKPLPVVLAILIIGISIVNALANYLFLYWRIGWLDMPMHFLGGAWVGAMGIWWYFYSDKRGARGNALMYTAPEPACIDKQSRNKEFNTPYFGEKPKLRTQTFLLFFTVSFLSVLAIGLLWEVFEYGLDIIFPTGRPYDIADTASDLMFDIVGGVCATLIFYGSRFFKKDDSMGST